MVESSSLYTLIFFLSGYKRRNMSCDNRRCLCCYGGCGGACDKCLQGYTCQCLRYRPCCGKVKPPCCGMCPFNEWRKMVLGGQTPQVQSTIQPTYQQPVQPQPTLTQQAYFSHQSYTNMNTIPANNRRNFQFY